MANRSTVENIVATSEGTLLVVTYEWNNGWVIIGNRRASTDEQVIYANAQPLTHVPLKVVKH